MSDTPPIPSAARPFSPSPARENRHTASRPPSILLGAPVPSAGTVAHSNTFNLTGLPSTPSLYTSILAAVPPPMGLESGQKGSGSKEGYFEPREQAEHGRKIDDEGNISGQFMGGQSRATMRRSNSESSSTSSSSPPLGATSLLATLAGPSSTGVNRFVERFPAPPHTPPANWVMPPQHARASSPTLTDHSPSSSNSAHSVASSNSSTAVDSLHSLPRLHQPTVVRGSAGRLSFLPPPAQISPSGSTFSLHQPGKRRISETRSDGFLPRVYTDRGNHGSADNMGHFGFGSMEALGRVVERSSGAEVRGVGLPNPVGTTDNMGRMAFSSMESLVGVTDQGDMRGLPGGGTEKMGSSVESLHRLLERSTPAKGFAGREPEDPETAGGLGDIIDQQKPGGTPHVAKNRIMSVSRPDTKSAVDAVVHGEGSDPSCGQVDRGRSEVEIKEIGQVVDQQSPIVATNFAGTNQRSPGQTSPVDTHDERPSQVPPIIPQSAGFTDGFYTNGVSNEEIGSSTNLNTATGRSQNDSAQHPEASLDPPGMADAVSVSTVHQTPSDAETRDSMPAEDDRQHAKSQQESLGGSRAETNGDQDSGMTSQGAVQKMDQLAQHAVDEQALPVKESETNGEVNGLHLRGNRNLCEPDPDDLQELPDEDKTCQSYSTSRDLSLLGTPADVPSQRMQEPEVQSAIGKNTSPINEKEALASTEVPTAKVSGPELDEVSKQMTKPADEAAVPHSPDAIGQVAEDNAGMLIPSTSSSYQPPYQPRIKNGIVVSSPAIFPSATLSEALSNEFSLTFHATLSRQPKDGPLPFSQPHMELRLAWPEPKWFKWVPGRKWVPAVSIKYVEGGEREMVVRRPAAEKRGMIRGLVKSVVQSLPVVWRLASWF